LSSPVILIGTRCGLCDADHALMCIELAFETEAASMIDPATPLAG